MGKMSELDLAIQGVQRTADELIATCKELMALCGNKEAADVIESPAPNPKPITLEQVRAVLAEKSRAGYTAEVRALLEKYGAAKLSEIDPTKYSALLKDAEVLKNG